MKTRLQVSGTEGARNYKAVTQLRGAMYSSCDLTQLAPIQHVTPSLHSDEPGLRSKLGLVGTITTVAKEEGILAFW